MTNYDLANKIISKLNNNGHEAFIVGGYVRDHILNIEANDIDITGSATPEEVIELFGSDNVIPTGIKFGTVMIIEDGVSFEHTTYRSDGAYNDSRHPESIKFSNDVKEDVKRRDFTINALLMDKDSKIYDYTNGLNDLELKQIKCIGNPDTRFKEDALRMLRAISFVSKLGFNIERNTKLSIIKNKSLLKNVSIERIKMELEKISKGKYRQKAWMAFYALGLNDIFPDFNVKISNYDVSFENILCLKMRQYGEISDFWQLSKSRLKTIEKASKMIDCLDEYNMYLYGYEASKLAYSFNGKDDFDFIYDNLEIKKTSDLNIKGNMLNINENLISECLNHLAYCVITKKIKNEKNELLEEARKWIMLQ